MQYAAGGHPRDVINLVITAPEQFPGQILVGVRRGSATRPFRHSNVVSTITRTLAPEHADGFGRSPAANGVCPAVRATSGRFGVGLDRHKGLVQREIESMLAQKVCNATHLTDGSLRGTFTHRSTTRDVVGDPGATEEWEDTVMRNYWLRLDSRCDARVLTGSTEFYDPLSFAPVSDLHRGFVDSHHTVWLDDLPFDGCVAGLCIRSALSTLVSDQTGIGLSPQVALA